MKKLPPYPLIFTDLDGTLLDHTSYSAAPANQLIAQIYQRSIAELIPITSKTRAELRSLQRSIPIEETISVTENGSVIYAPEGFPLWDEQRSHTILLGMDYAGILDRIGKLPNGLRQHVTGFADMSAAEVAHNTGLAIDDARRAKSREATEPFLWTGSIADLDELREHMAETNIQVQRGGRFYHFTGYANKEQAMTQIKDAFIGQKTNCEIIAIALGDGPNDLAMIEAADIGVIMPNPDGVTISTMKSHVRTATAPGPRGWDTAIREIFAEMGLILTES